MTTNIPDSQPESKSQVESTSNGDKRPRFQVSPESHSHLEIEAASGNDGFSFENELIATESSQECYHFWPEAIRKIYSFLSGEC